MDKYKNKNGTMLSFTSNDLHTQLVKEVVQEAIKILGMYDRNCKISMGMAINNCKKFLRLNFSLDEMSGGKVNRSDEWIVKQFNRNRSPEDQITSVEDME